jgi:hypothetical protein
MKTYLHGEDCLIPHNYRITNPTTQNLVARLRATVYNNPIKCIGLILKYLMYAFLYSI